MTDTRELCDPFTNETVKISARLTDRLRGRYACGPTLPDGEPEFGWRQFETPPVQHEAADEIERLRGALVAAEEYLSGKELNRALVLGVVRDALNIER